MSFVYFMVRDVAHAQMQPDYGLGYLIKSRSTLGYSTCVRVTCKWMPVFPPCLYIWYVRCAPTKFQKCLSNVYGIMHFMLTQNTAKRWHRLQLSTIMSKKREKRGRYNTTKSAADMRSQIKKIFIPANGQLNDNKKNIFTYPFFKLSIIGGKKLVAKV